MVGEGKYVMEDIRSGIEGTSRNVGWGKGLQFGVWELVQESNSPLVCHIHHHEFKKQFSCRKLQYLEGIIHRCLPLPSFGVAMSDFILANLTLNHIKNQREAEQNGVVPTI